MEDLADFVLGRLQVGSPPESKKLAGKRCAAFNCLDYLDRAGEAIADLGKWFGEGKIQYRADVVEGLENAVNAFNRLFDGSTMGKLMVKISEDPSD